MDKNEKYFFEKIKSDDSDLYKTFIAIAENSTREENKKLRLYSIKIIECYELIKNKGVTKAETIIEKYITELITYELIKYDDESNSKIILTKKLNENCGFSIYKHMLENIQNEKISNNTNKLFENLGDNLKEELKEDLESYKKEIGDLRKTLDDGIIKNIQVISIFAGIISLLFANVMGIKEFKGIGVLGLVFINSSMIMSIFSLIVFTKQIIINKKFTFVSFIICVITIIFTFLPIILLFAFKNKMQS